VHRAACLPCPQLLAHMHCVHLTLQHFRKKSIFNFSWPPAFNPLSSALGCVAYPMGGVRASPSSRARAEWSPDNEKMVSKAVVYPMADTKQLYASCARTYSSFQKSSMNILHPVSSIATRTVHLLRSSIHALQAPVKGERARSRRVLACESSLPNEHVLACCDDDVAKHTLHETRARTYCVAVCV
jgi:hypothetical protein